MNNKEKYMDFTKMNTLYAKILLTFGAIAACCVLTMVLSAAPRTTATTESAAVQQKTFDTPQQAADAMILAVKNDDVAALLEIFGPDGKDFVDTKDDVQDKNSRAAVATLAQEKMHVDIDPHNASRAIVSLGEEDWPLPVPIVKQAGKWYF